MSESETSKSGFESRLEEKTAAGETSLDDIKPLINEGLEYLENTTNYGTEVYDVLRMIRCAPKCLMNDVVDGCNSILEVDTNQYTKLCHEVSQYLIQKEFPRIAVKLATSLQEKLDTIGIADQSSYPCQVNMYMIYDIFVVFTGVYPMNAAPFCRSICKEGIVNVSQRALLYFDDPGNKIPDKAFDVTVNAKKKILSTLYNIILECPDYRDKYRASNIIDTLSKVLKTDVEDKTLSLLILAHIVDEQENEMLLRSQDSIRYLTEMFAKAVVSPEHIVSGDSTLGYDARELLDGINHLAISDANKQEILKCGGVQAIIKMLQPEFSEDERKLATDALWNLAFDDNIKKDPEVQKAIASKNAEFTLYCYVDSCDVYT